MHKSLHFWLYAAAITWWIAEVYVQNSGTSDSTLTGLYGQLASVDAALPGAQLTPSFIPTGALYLLAGGAIAHKMGH